MSLQEFFDNICKLPVRVGSINLGQQKFIREFFSNHPEVKTVLETGFHTGLSAAVMMDCRPDITVVSFDIFWFDYTRRAKLLLDIAFPGRNTLIAGNSINTIPTFFTMCPSFNPDFVFIDGGHERPIPFIDLWYILKHVRPGTWVMIDDYCETHGTQGVIEAVNIMITDGILIDGGVYKCDDRGWAFGQRSAAPMIDTDLVKPHYIDALLRDTESHYP
jgi:hypothetical protein